MWNWKMMGWKANIHSNWLLDILRHHNIVVDHWGMHLANLLLLNGGLLMFTSLNLTKQLMTLGQHGHILMVLCGIQQL
jgi:hypothetical protein